MKNIIILLILFVGISSCGKDEIVEDRTKASACLLKMRDYLAKELYCKEDAKTPYSSNLVRASYEGKIVYYSQVSCAECLVAEAETGYTCDLEKINFEDPRKILDRKIVFDSCSKQYSE